MNRAFIFLTILAALHLLGGQTHAKSQKPSKDMMLILIHYKSGPNDLDVKKLTKDQTKTVPNKTDMAEFEVCEVPYPQGVADYFSYIVYLHTPSGRYWIHQSGGFAGVSHFYGPGLVKDLRQ